MRQQAVTEAMLVHTLKSDEFHALATAVDKEISDSPESKRGYTTIDLPRLASKTDVHLDWTMVQAIKLAYTMYGWNIQPLDTQQGLVLVLSLQKAAAFHVAQFVERGMLVEHALKETELIEQYTTSSTAPKQPTSKSRRGRSTRSRINRGRPAYTSKPACTGKRTGHRDKRLYNVAPEKATCGGCGGGITYPQRICPQCGTGITWRHTRVR